MSWGDKFGFAGKLEDAWHKTTSLLGGWWDRAGDQAAEGVQDIKRGAGGILSDFILEPIGASGDAKEFFKELASAPLEGAGHGLQVLFGAGEIVTSPVGGVGWGNIGEALDAPYQYLVEPAATDFLLGMKNKAGGSFRDGVTIPEAIDLGASAISAMPIFGGNPLAGTGMNPAEKLRAKRERQRHDYSLGQAVAMFGSPDPADQQAVKHYQEGAVFNAVATTGDVLGPAVLDPINALGGVGAGARAARWGTKAGDDLTQLFAKKRVAEVADDIWGMAEHNPGQAESLIRDKYLRNEARGHVMADLLGTAQSREEVELTLRFGGGDLRAGEQLGAYNPALSNKMRRLYGDQRLLRASNDSDDPDLAAALADLQAEIDATTPLLVRQNRQQYIAATLQQVPHSSRANDLRFHLTRSDTYHQRLGAPLRVVYQQRHHNFLAPDDGSSDQQFWYMLQKTPLSAEEQTRFHADYLRAPSAHHKAQLVEHAQDSAMSRILHRYGYDPSDVEEILRRSGQGRTGFRTVASQRFAPEGKDVWEIVEDGVTHHVRAPLTVSQHEQVVPLIRIKDFEKVAARYSPLERKNAHRFAEDALTGQTKLTGSRKASEVSFAIAEAGLQDFQRLWKASVLLRPAYIARVPLGEEQLRIMALTSVLAVPRWVKNGAHNMREDYSRVSQSYKSKVAQAEEKQGRALNRRQKQAVAKRAYREYSATEQVYGFRSMPVDSLSGETYAYDAPFGFDGGRGHQQRVSTSAAFDQTFGRDTNLFTQDLERQYGEFHGTGKWKENIAWTDEAGKDADLNRVEWTQSHVNFTTRHIANDAAYRMVLQQQLDNQLGTLPDAPIRRGGFPAELDLERVDVGYLEAHNDTVIDWLLSPSGASYWGRMDDALRQDLDGWLTRMRDIVESYLPTAQMKKQLLDGQLSLDDVGKNWPTEIPRPVVHGEEIAWQRPEHPGRKARKKVIDGLWRSIVSLPTERMSRNQLFNHVYDQEVKRHTSLLERQMSVGKARADVYAPGRADAEYYTVSLEERAAIQGKARDEALQVVRKKLYDMSTESDLSHALRFVSPFFKAWQEVLTVWGGIALDNPVFVNEMRHIWETPDRLGLTVTDPVSKEEYLVLPVPQVVRDHFPGGALKDVKELKFSKKGFNTIMTATPGTGPWVGVAVAELTKDNPEVRSHRAMSILFPFSPPDSATEALVSSTLLKNITATFDADSKQQANLVYNLYSAQMLDFHQGRRTSRPDWDEITEQAKNMMALRTVANAFLPTGAQFVGPFQPYLDTWRALQEDERRRRADGTWKDGDPTADQRFYDAYGPEFFSLVASKTRGAFPPTLEAWREYSKPGIAKLFADHPEYASLVLGSGADAGAFNANVYDWQLRTRIRNGGGVTIREELDPRTAYERQRAEAGWMEWKRNSHIITEELTRMGLDSYRDPRAGHLKRLRNEMIYKMSQDYPEWFEQFNVLDLGKWNRRAQDLEQIAMSPSLTGRPEIEGLREYLELRGEVVSEMVERARANNTSLVNSNLKANSNADLARTWLGGRDRLVERNPAFASLFHRWLERDTLGAEWEN